MRDDIEIISHPEMCSREGIMLQRGMYFQGERPHSVLLMSVRINAPYSDVVLEDGSMLIYEGHDVSRSAEFPYPKQIDQPMHFPSGLSTENGRFYQAALDYKVRSKGPRRVRVYEKIKTGIWSYNGLFELIDAEIADSNNRKVFRFKLRAIPDEASMPDTAADVEDVRHRLIPTHVKREVWKRDRGRCRVCNADTELHFDHIIPFSRGGSSATVENVQLLCRRHNLQKHDLII